ncbi:30S ribosomal protein S16 [Candidatus Sumerlaeota bacterium]|nr:30S ribosomal protein S16 [Candidatus Sumerlaeota bacterium]
MSVAIRLSRVGRRKSPFYRMVVADSRFPRDGRFIEIIGHYQPLRAQTQLQVDEERAMHWLNVGAQPSDTCRSLLRQLGVMKKWHERRVEARKARRPPQAALSVGDAPSVVDAPLVGDAPLAGEAPKGDV